MENRNEKKGEKTEEGKNGGVRGNRNEKKEMRREKSHKNREICSVKVGGKCAKHQSNLKRGIILLKNTS